MDLPHIDTHTRKSFQPILRVLIKCIGFDSLFEFGVPQLQFRLDPIPESSQSGSALAAENLCLSKQAPLCLEHQFPPRRTAHDTRLVMVLAADCSIGRKHWSRFDWKPRERFALHGSGLMNA